MKRIFIFMTIALAMTGAVFGQAQRVGTQQWKLIALDNVDVPASSNAYIEIDAAKGRFTGHTGCNRMFGSVVVRNRRISFTNVGSTKMACTDPRSRRIETAFLNALHYTDRFRRDKDSLELYDYNRFAARLTVQHKQDPVDNRRIGLEDRKWMLEAIRGVPVSKAGRTAFVVFDAVKRSAGGDSSCNVFGGSYASSGSKLSITDVISTMRACEEDDRMMIERSFLDGLRQTNRYEIARGKLMFYRNNRLLLTFNGERK